MFHMLPASAFRLFEPLLILCVKAEKALNIEVRHVIVYCYCLLLLFIVIV